MVNNLSEVRQVITLVGVVAGGITGLVYGLERSVEQNRSFSAAFAVGASYALVGAILGPTVLQYSPVIAPLVIIWDRLSKK